MKKVISLFLSLTMLLSIVSVVDFSAYASVKTGMCGDNVTYSLDTSTGVLTISGTGKMNDYNPRYESPFYNKSYVKSVIIENGVTSIGSYAFEDCTSLTSVTIPDSVISIGDDAFYGCSSLKSITIPNGVTSIGRSAFYSTAYYEDKSNWDKGVLYLSNCLIDINDDFDSTTDYIIKDGTRIIAGEAFKSYTSLKSVTIPNSVISIGGSAFSGCSNLTNATIGNGVTSIGERAFNDCKNLASITIPDSVTTIGNYAFNGCRSLTDVTIGNSVTSIGECAFNVCTSLTNVTIGNSVTSIGDWAFSSCTSLTSVTIPNSVISIGENAFSDCTSLTNVTIGNSVTSIGDYAFYNTAYYNDKSNWNNGVLYISNCLIDTNNNFKSTTDYIIKDGTIIIAGEAFRGRTSLTSVTIPNSVTSIGYRAFYECTSLTSVTIPNSVISIDREAFSYCTSLKFVDYNGTKTQWKAIAIGSDNYYLTHSIIKCTDGIIGNGNTVTIDNLKYQLNNDQRASLVGYIDSPENLMIPKSVLYEGYTVTVKSIGDKAFYNCTSLTSATIPDSVKSIGDYAFCNCTSLTSATIPDSVKSIGDYAFCNCTSLTSVTIPDSVTSIGDHAFDCCTSLTSVTIPNSVTSIGNYTFSGCTSLTSVTISGSVTSIGRSAFYNCTSLTSIDYNGTVSQWKSIKGYGNVSKIIKCKDGIVGNGNTVTIDNLKYKIYDDTASLVGYIDPPENLVIPEKISYEGYTLNVTSIGESAFSGCTSLTSVNYSGTKSQWKAITIGSDNYYLIHAFIKCTDGIIGNGNTVTVDSVKYRLNDDYTAQVISYSGTPENITISECVFYEGYTFKVTSIGSSAFKDCTSLTSITIPDSVTTIGNNAFSGCTNLTSATIGNSVTSIGSSAFKDCTSLTSVTIPDSVTSIGDNTFNGCSKLKKIEIPDSVTYIGSKAFDGTAFYNTVKNWEDGVLYCGNHLISAKSDVTKITVKASTVSIAAGALDNCKSLEKINVLNPKCVINCTIPKTAVIGGAEGSTAEDFAQKNNMSIDYFEECTHSDKVQVVIAATCTEQGAVQSRCADCDKLISQTFTAPLGHTMVITTPAKAPTCTTSGNTQAGYCTVCGYNEVSTVIPATGHNFGNNSANCLVCGVANPNYVAPTQPNQNDTNTSNDEDVTVISKPKSASIKKVKGAKKAVSVEWKKVSGVSGYEIQVATDKKFKKNKKTVTIKKQKTTKTTVKKLKAKKKYYVRVRTYKIVNGKRAYSSWSKVKSVKTK